MKVAARALEYAALTVACGSLATGYMIFCMEWLPALARVARVTVRAARLVFLAVGWAAVIVRLVL